ncbi:MAG: hypothetical protein IT374_27985 [Polyangiaceae bacterium]|nr:hypothetical protein [Polyangiaceae bacterium]
MTVRALFPLALALLAGCGSDPAHPTVTPPGPVAPPLATSSLASTASAAPSAPASAVPPAAASAAPTALASASAKPGPFAGKPLFVACGCGCCGGVEPERACLYHQKGDDPAKLEAADDKAAKSPGCAAAGCSRGTAYYWCD